MDGYTASQMIDEYLVYKFESWIQNPLYPLALRMKTVESRAFFFGAALTMWTWSLVASEEDLKPGYHVGF